MGDETAGDVKVDGSRTFGVGGSGWFRLVRGYHADDAESERTVGWVEHPPKLEFEWYDGTLHVARSSSGIPD